MSAKLSTIIQYLETWKTPVEEKIPKLPTASNGSKTMEQKICLLEQFSKIVRSPLL